VTTPPVRPTNLLEGTLFLTFVQLGQTGWRSSPSTFSQLCNATLAAKRVRNPLSSWGRSRWRPKELTSFSHVVSTIWRIPATHLLKCLGQFRLRLLRLGG
jgi:hypothetical protein